MRILSPGVAALFVVPLASVACAGEALKLDGPTMGTYYSVVVDSPSTSLGDGKQLAAKIEARLTEINRQMSTWDDASEISAFNRSRSTDWQEVSAEFAAVVTEAKRIHSLTNGAFDPTVSPLIDLWGFGDHRQKTVPAAAAIEVALKSTGMQHLEMRTDPPALKKHLPELQLNLSELLRGMPLMRWPNY